MLRGMSRRLPPRDDVDEANDIDGVVRGKAQG